jgi:16S rRNA (uracil1498-N3)-methyltransferase
MESLYTPHLTEGASNVALEGDALKHAQVLRLREGERVLLSNGEGLCARTEIQEVRKHEILCAIQEFLPQHGELVWNGQPVSFTLALGILDNRERMEFAIEKAVEMGVTEIFPLITDHSERYAANRIKPERLTAKAIAAMEQSHRSVLPSIHASCTIQELQTVLSADTAIILADPDGTSPTPLQSKGLGQISVCICVGAEGGFSERELSLLRTDSRTIAWNLAPRRLRAETAALMCLSVATLMFPFARPTLSEA